MIKKTKTTKTKAAAPAKVTKTKALKPTTLATAKAATPVVKLEFAQPGVASVAVAGSFNAWQPEPAKSTAAGAWVKELAVSPGRYEYLFVVDGQWLPDPKAKEFAPNPFGGQNSVLVVG
jgi:1,4-alpha-glucan branching enzyme